MARMIGKKLVTLACAAGILACGACFLPPLPQHQPPPPAILIDLQGIQSIHVEATNISPSRHLDPDDLAGEAARAINAQSGKAGVSAHAGKEQGDADAVLQITVVNEDVELNPQVTPRGSRGANFYIKDSATLTRRNGVVLWRETEVRNLIFREISEAAGGEVWKDPAQMNGLDSVLGYKLVFRMFHVR